MKQSKYLFLGLLMVSFIIANTSCSKWIETSDNGHLDGFWHLDSVDTLSTNGTLDLTDARIFWSVQGTLFSLYAPDMSGSQRYVSQFSYHDNTFVILDLRVDNRIEGDPEVTDITKVQHFGVNKTKESFVIENLKSNKMTLRSETLKLWFTKM